jgi:hypothetical protein
MTMNTDTPTKKDILLQGFANKTGLAVLTVEDLIRKGWVFIEPGYWSSPIAQREAIR